MTLRAPYNFIPLHRRVFLPAWRNTINMDIPFEDGVSGCMNVTIHAQTPIYVRNGLPKEEAERLKKEAFEATQEKNRLNEYTKFNHIGNKYFIPGSSIKGLLRSTIEILSLGKFKQIEDQSFNSRGKYKHPYKYSVHAVINQMSEELLTDDMDLAECLFGKVSNEEALRGRVHVGQAFHTGTILHLPSVMPILGQPHPSYSPLYLPNGTNWDTARAVNGRKMYPTRDNPWSNNTEVVKSATIFCPIDKGAIFKGKIHFFNLKKEELGALIAAIEIMGEKDKYHAIGSGKPLGYGRVTIETSDLECMTNNNGQSLDKKGYIDLFKSTMAGFDPGWYKSLTIQEFLILASGIPDNPPNLFDYMKMSNNKDENEFEQESKRGRSLPRFSALLNGTVSEESAPVNVHRNNVKPRINKVLPITDQEKKEGWELSSDRKYRAFIKADNTMRILSPEKDKKGIMIRYELMNTDVSLTVDTMVDVLLDEFDDDNSTVLVKIVKKFPPKENNR